MCVLYANFGSKIRPRLLLYSVGSGVNRVQVVLSGFSKRLFILSMQQLYVGMVVCISWLYSCLCVRCDGDVICVGHDLNWCSWWWYICLQCIC